MLLVTSRCFLENGLKIQSEEDSIECVQASGRTMALNQPTEGVLLGQVAFDATEGLPAMLFGYFKSGIPVNDRPKSSDHYRVAER